MKERMASRNAMKEERIASRKELEADILEEREFSVFVTFFSVLVSAYLDDKEFFKKKDSAL